MLVIGIDAHKRSHTAVAVDGLGRQVAVRTVNAATADHLGLLRWAEQLDSQRSWAVEDCRHVSRRLERDLLVAGERIVRVPPKLMARARDGARTVGKSDPIDALAVARAALREPDLPTACLDGPARTVRLLVDHRDDLVAERTRIINRLRWHLHELDSSWDPRAGSMDRYRTLDAIAARLDEHQGTVAAHRSRSRRALSSVDNRYQRPRARDHRAGHSARAHTAGDVWSGGADRREDRRRGRRRTPIPVQGRVARHTGTAPQPAWSGQQDRHRLSRTGNRQLNTALHRIALTQGRYHPDAIAYLARRRAAGDTKNEARRALKRRLSDVVYRALLADATQTTHALTPAA